MVRGGSECCSSAARTININIIEICASMFWPEGFSIGSGVLAILLLRKEWVCVCFFLHSLLASPEKRLKTGIVVQFFVFCLFVLLTHL